MKHMNEKEIGLVPQNEPDRQYYFIERASRLLKERFEKMVASGEAETIYGKEQLEHLLDKKRYGTFHITTFGCQMNARDSEKLLGILEAVGYESVDTEEADFVLYNTCTVRENANLREIGRAHV